jgi:long-subunit acyl-CoA synthetase (AMP-forming)
VNYRLKQEDIAYIFEHGDAEVIIVDEEFLPLLEMYRSQHPDVALIVDTDTDATEGELTGPFDEAVLEGLKYDLDNGSQGWEGLESQAADEESVMALAYTSGTTAKPKGVEFTHRGCYLATLANVIESGLNYHRGRARYLWTLPMFHAMGSFPCSIHSIQLTIYHRMDIPMGSNSSSRHPLLSQKDRLS